MKRLAIVGSRRHPDLSVVRDYVMKVKDVIVVTGGAWGVDKAAEEAARARGLDVVVYRPDYNKHGKYAPLERNKLIVANSDALIAFWDGLSTGTMHIVTLAEKKGLPVRVLTYSDQSRIIRSQEDG